MTSKPEPTRRLLNNPVFQGIHQRVALHDELLRRIKAALPAPLAAHCLHCVAREDGGLLLYTDSQAFASQFRFLAPSLQNKLNAAGDLSVQSIAIRNLAVALPGAAEKPRTPMKAPSPEAVEAVRASGDCAGEDELGEALARLADSMERYARKRP